MKNLRLRSQNKKTFLNKIYLSLSFLISINIFNVFAQSSQPLKELNVLTGSLGTTLTNVVGLLNIVAFIVYIGLVIAFIYKRSKGDTGGMKEFQSMLLWGIVAMFFLVAVWGMVWFISKSLGVAIGGCAAKPSPIPGMSVEDNCVKDVIRTPSDSRVPTGSVVRPVEPKKEEKDEADQWMEDSVDDRCYNGRGEKARNGDLLYCYKGEMGEPCIKTSCGFPRSCVIDDPTLTIYGKCGPGQSQTEESQSSSPEEEPQSAEESAIYSNEAKYERTLWTDPNPPDYVPQGVCEDSYGNPIKTSFGEYLMCNSADTADSSPNNFSTTGRGEL